MKRCELTRRSFLFLRHGESDWNREGRCVGQADRPLTALGRRQAEAARAFCAVTNLTVFHSPLIRAAETARIIARGTAWRLIPENGLMEACLGDKEGRPETDAADDFIAHWFAGGTIANAEPYADFRARVVQAVNRCLAAEGAALVVAHSAVYAALSDTTGHGVGDIDHCAPCRFMPSPDGWTIAPIV